MNDDEILEDIRKKIMTIIPRNAISNNIDLVKYYANDIASRYGLEVASIVDGGNKVFRITLVPKRIKV